MNAPYDWDSYVYAINNLDQIAGAGTRRVCDWRGVCQRQLVPALYAYRTVVEQLPGAEGAVIFDINNNGIKVGKVNQSGQLRAAMWDSENRLSVIPVSGLTAHAKKVNNEGVIIGQYNNSANLRRAFVYKDGSVQDLSSLDRANAFSVEANDINDNGQIVGVSHDHGSTKQAVLWYESKAVKLAGDSRFYEYGATAIDSSGKLIGGFAKKDISDSPNSRRAALWVNGKLFDLRDLICSKQLLKDVVEINENGHILVTVHDQSRDNPALLLRLAGEITSNQPTSGSSNVSRFSAGIE